MRKRTLVLTLSILACLVLVGCEARTTGMLVGKDRQANGLGETVARRFQIQDDAGSVQWVNVSRSTFTKYDIGDTCSVSKTPGFGWILEGCW